jgi:hypothetical protein
MVPCRHFLELLVVQQPQGLAIQVKFVPKSRRSGLDADVLHFLLQIGEGTGHRDKLLPPRV